jgi:hypothetical protein
VCDQSSAAEFKPSSARFSPDAGADFFDPPGPSPRAGHHIKDSHCCAAGKKVAAAEFPFTACLNTPTMRGVGERCA